MPLHCGQVVSTFPQGPSGPGLVHLGVGALWQGGLEPLGSCCSPRVPAAAGLGVWLGLSPVLVGCILIGGSAALQVAFVAESTPSGVLPGLAAVLTIVL